MNETNSLKPISQPCILSHHKPAQMHHWREHSWNGLAWKSIVLSHLLSCTYISFFQAAFSPPDSQYHPPRKREQTLVELPSQHIQPANSGLEDSQVLHHRGPNRTSKLPLTTDFYEIQFFAAVALDKTVQNWANRSEVERAGQALCTLLSSFLREPTTHWLCCSRYPNIWEGVTKK